MASCVVAMSVVSPNSLEASAQPANTSHLTHAQRVCPPTLKSIRHCARIGGRNALNCKRKAPPTASRARQRAMLVFGLSPRRPLGRAEGDLAHVVEHKVE